MSVDLRRALSVQSTQGVSLFTHLYFICFLREELCVSPINTSIHNHFALLAFHELGVLHWFRQVHF